MEDKELNLEKICRACTNECERMYSLFEFEIFLNQPLQLSEMFMACTSIQIHDNDKMPKSLCVSCLEQLNAAFNFKNLCQNTNYYLQNYVEKQRKTDTIQIESTTILKSEPEITDHRNSVKHCSEQEDVHSCKQCNKYFINFNSLDLHISKNHQNIDLVSCDLCAQEVSSELLAEHIQITHAKKLYTCKICEKMCLYEKLKEHLLLHNNNKSKSLVCDICNQNFSKEDALQSHMDTHKKDGENIKDSLESVLDHYTEIKNLTDIQSAHNDVGLSGYLSDHNESETDEKTGLHIKTELGIEDIKIKSEYFVQPDENVALNKEIVNTNVFKRKRGRPKKGEELLSKNKAKLLKTINYPCAYCDKILKTKVGFDIHNKKHGGEEIIECERCSEQFQEIEKLFDHSNAVHQENDANITKKCDLCEELFNNFEDYVRHKFKSHNIRIKILISKRFSCQYCPKSFSSEKYRDIHEKTHTNERKRSCKTCGEIFKTRNSLNEHLKSHEECSKKFLCSECGQRFIRHDYLVIHMRRHRGEKPFKCKYCGKGFPRTTDLIVHERYHTGEKTHLCMVCGRGFGRAYNLTVHMRTHTGEKPYQCTYCDAAFAQGNDLKAHVRRHTGERYHCDICSEAFLMGYLLTQHKRTIHGLDVKSHIRRLKPSERVNLQNSLTNDSVTDISVATFSEQLQLVEALQNVNILSSISDNLTETDDNHKILISPTVVTSESVT